MSARLKLHMLRWAREKPTTVIVVLIFVALALLSLLRRCPPCEACRRVAQPVAISALATAAAASSETVLLDALPRDFRDDDERTTMAHVVIGVMTARRFHKTRCRAQMETWLRRARRVVFFSDSSEGAPSYDLQAPLVAHHFVPSATERIFEGGNWRAVPILRALAHGFFSEPAQAAMRERAEPLPRWTFMLDDDSYVFTDQMLAAVAGLDADKPHYLGYAFIAAPHLEGIVPGKRQPLFANGGAGIAVSRGALTAALPIFAECEATYKWNWPGDVRVAQCLLDAGVSLTWIHAFHAEAPGVIIHKQRPPPGSVPVGLHLPPISFHHIDADALHSLDRMHTARIEVGGRPLEADFSAHAFQPLSATHPASKVQLQMHYGFEVLVCPPGDSGCGTGGGRGGDIGEGDDGAATGLTGTLTPGKYLASFEAAPSRGDQPSAYLHSFTGGECRQRGRLMGGLSAVVATHCGRPCDAPSSGGSWQASSSPSGLTVCNFSLVNCALHVHVALPRCPRPLPVRRVGLDAGTAPGYADVATDGVASRKWAAGCSAGEDGGSQCASLNVAASGNLTLWLRVLSGSAVARLHGPSVSRPGLQVAADQATLLLSGAVPEPERQEDGEDDGAALEPPATGLALQHACEPGATGAFEVRLALAVRRHMPIELAWTAHC